MKRKQERGEKCLFLFLLYSCILKEVPVFWGKENRQQTGTKIRKCVYSIRRYRNMKWNRFTMNEQYKITSTTGRVLELHYQGGVLS